MRIIAGSAKGHSLKIPREVSRPTTDRVRESVFGILTAVIPNARVLDLYAGSGALGIEALSRGGASCTFVEQNRGACRVIAENLNKTGYKEGRVIQRDVGAFLNSEKTSYDLIFADPPYADGLSDPARDLIAIEGWEQWLAKDGFLILEREAAGELPDPKELVLVQSRDYGRSRIAIYQLES